MKASNCDTFAILWLSPKNFTLDVQRSGYI
jgi:hypothetical protein